MGEISYDLTLLFPDESKAESLGNTFLELLEGCHHELTCMVNKACKPADPLSGDNYTLDYIKRFRNEIQISCYSGRLSEIPEKFVPVFHSSGAHSIHILARYDEGAEDKYFVDGKKASKRTFDQYYKKHKLEDDTDKLQRFLSNSTFTKALNIIDQCDLSRIKPENDYLLDSLTDKRYQKIALSLLPAGLYDGGDITHFQDGTTRSLPWLLKVVEYSSREGLEAFLDYGYDPYGRGDGDVTAFHDCLTSSEICSVENCQLLIERYSENLNPVTKYGSPLWYGYEQQTNLVNCHAMKKAGARIIPPKGYYDELNDRDLIVKSIQHHDFASFEQHYRDDFFYESLYWSLRYQSHEIVSWLNNKQEIDWLKSFSGLFDAKDKFEQSVMDCPAYEVPFYYSEGLNCDEDLIDYIVNSVPSDKDIYTRLAIYIAGLNGLPNSVALLKQLLENGSDFSAASIINGNDDKLFSLYQALFHEALDNFEFLLQAGAEIPDDPDIEDESLDELIRIFCEGENRKLALGIFKKYSS